MEVPIDTRSIDKHGAQGQPSKAGVPVRLLQFAPGRCSHQGRISRGQQLVVIIQPAGQLQQAAVTPVVVH